MLVYECKLQATAAQQTATREASASASRVAASGRSRVHAPPPLASAPALVATFSVLQPRPQPPGTRRGASWPGRPSIPPAPAAREDGARTQANALVSSGALMALQD